MSSPGIRTDRKSTRLNSSHGSISYAGFCLKKKPKQMVLPWLAVSVAGRREQAMRFDPFSMGSHYIIRPVLAEQIPLPLADFFFLHDTATADIYTLSLHDALPILRRQFCMIPPITTTVTNGPTARFAATKDRKSTRLNSSHGSISYAVFCLKK